MCELFQVKQLHSIILLYFLRTYILQWELIILIIIIRSHRNIEDMDIAHSEDRFPVIHSCMSRRYKRPVSQRIQTEDLYQIIDPSDMCHLFYSVVREHIDQSPTY